MTVPKLDCQNPRALSAYSVVYQHPQHGAGIVWDLGTRPEGPYHPLLPESAEPALLS